MGPNFESVNLSHFGGQADPWPPRVLVRFRFYADLVRFASLADPVDVRRTPVRCRKRPGRRRCGGLLVVRRRDLPPVIEWECPACSTAGQIGGWEETEADLRRWEFKRGDEVRSVAVSVAAHAELRELAWIESSLIPLAYSARVDEAGEPCLFVGTSDSFRHSAAITQHALTVSNRRRTLLVDLIEALAPVTEDQVAPGFMALDPAGCEEPVGKLLALADVLSPEFVPARPRPRPKLVGRRRAKPQTFRIKVTLRGVRPPVWRRLVVPSDIKLPTLHEVLQVAMGWCDGHLHLFRVGDHEFAPPGDYDPIGDDSRGVSLDEIAPGKGSRVIYEYDFGDGWCHDIVVEEVIDERCSSVRCLKGRRCCPPEDCGGPWGYAELREAFADSTHDRHAEVREWISEDFDPDEFDLIETDVLVRRVRV